MQPVEVQVGIDDFKDTTPEFLPEEFFDGKLEGWAVLESLIGGLQKRATIAAEGRWSHRSISQKLISSTMVTSIPFTS
jgi:hypothetical protein